MKLLQISAFAFILLSMTAQLFAGSQPDVLEEISPNPMKRKGAPSQIFSPSKRIQRTRKKVSFALADETAKTRESSKKKKGFRFSQDEWGSLLNYNETTGDYCQLILKKHEDSTAITQMRLEDMEAQLSSRSNFILHDVLPDSEWEYSFSILEYAFGLIANCDERMKVWTDKARTPAEALLVWKALRFHFNCLNGNKLINFMANLRRMKDYQTRELQESKYYNFQATHTLFEEALIPKDNKEFNYLALPPNQRYSKALVKKVDILKAEIRQFEEAARKGKIVIKSIIMTGLFGEESYQESLLSKLKEFYVNGAEPRCLLTLPSDEKTASQTFCDCLKTILVPFY